MTTPNTLSTLFHAQESTLTFFFCGKCTIQDYQVVGVSGFGPGRSDKRSAIYVVCRICVLVKYKAYTQHGEFTHIHSSCPPSPLPRPTPPARINTRKAKGPARIGTRAARRAPRSPCAPTRTGVLHSTQYTAFLLPGRIMVTHLPLSPAAAPRVSRAAQPSKSISRRWRRSGCSCLRKRSMPGKRSTSCCALTCMAKSAASS